MRGFRAGEFERDSVPAGLRAFSPKESVDALEAVRLQELWDQGKRVLMLDVDNTLLPWRAEEIPQATVAWIEQAQSLGFRLCLLSNTRHPERLHRIAGALGVDVVRGKFKPSRGMYRLALEKYGLEPEQAVMVGDQLLTDVLGANRSGVDAVWVRPLGRREFVGTRWFSRTLERALAWLLYRYFRDESDLARPGVFSAKTLRQAVKFGLIGGLSTVIDVGLHALLMFAPLAGGVAMSQIVGEALLGPGTHTAKQLADASYAPLKAPGTALAILNSYFWNRQWTFRVAGDAPHGPMIARFYAVAVVGLLLNLGVGSAVNRALHMTPGKNWAGATVVATVVVFFWNFFAQRHFTFGKHQR